MNRIDQDTENTVRRFLTLIDESYEVVGVIVFGSRVRGTHRPDSDADVAVLLRGEHRRFLTTKLAMADMAFDVLLETGINISPLPLWLDEWEQPENYSNPALGDVDGACGRAYYAIFDAPRTALDGFYRLCLRV